MSNGSESGVSPDEAANEALTPVWEVFVQLKSGAPYQHAGNVHAEDAEMALQNARDVYARRENPCGIWVVPADAITASQPEDMGPFFDPGNDKPYRHPTFYKVPHGVKNL